MASYDVTDSAMKGYSLIWNERAYLLRLAFFPFFIKFVCAITVTMNGFDFDFTKQALLMLPSYFADGWVMSHLVRLIYLDQRWPFRPTGNPQNDMAMLRDRAGGIMAGTVCFALIEFLKTGISGFIFTAATPPGSVPGQMPTTPVVPPEGVASIATPLIGIAMIVVTIWVVRYIWLYIPAAAGFSGREYLKRVGGLMGSIRLLGIWMICTIPLAVAYSMMMPAFDPAKPLPVSLAFFMNLIHAAVQMIITLITTAGVAYAIRSMFMPPAQKR